MIRILLIAAITVSAGSANSHPHVYVDAGGTFLFDEDGRLSGVRISWLYDPFATLVLYDTLDLDQDRDGALNADDLEKVKRGETEWNPDYEGDTYLWINGTKQALSRPANAEAWMDGEQVGVAFDLFLATPVDMSGSTASLKLYDPIYYYSYAVLDGVTVQGLAPSCNTDVINFVPDAEAAELQQQLLALSQEEIPDDPNVGARFAEEILLQCD